MADHFSMFEKRLSLNSRDSPGSFIASIYTFININSNVDKYLTFPNPLNALTKSHLEIVRCDGKLSKRSREHALLQISLIQTLFPTSICTSRRISNSNE